MNQRIKDLISEATGYTMSVYESNGVRTFGERVEFFDKEKFARLMVEECVAQCEKNAEHPYLGPGSRLSAFNIKEHFGVEE